MYGYSPSFQTEKEVAQKDSSSLLSSSVLSPAVLWSGSLLIEKASSHTGMPVRAHSHALPTK